MDPSMSHLADVNVCIFGADGSRAEVHCSKLLLHKSSPILSEMLSSDMAFSLKRDADGMHTMELRNDRLPASACADTLVLMHDPAALRAWDFARGLATVEVHRYLDMPMGELLDNLASQCDTPDRIMDIVNTFDLAEISSQLDPLVERASDLAEAAARDGDLDGMVPIMAFLRTFAADSRYVRDVINFVLKDLRPTKVLEWVGSKCDNPGHTHVLLDACDLATMRVPPILVACTLAQNGLLNEDTYTHVIARNAMKTTPSDYEVLRFLVPDLPEELRDVRDLLAQTARSSPKAVYPVDSCATTYLINGLASGKAWTSIGGHSSMMATVTIPAPAQDGVSRLHIRSRDKPLDVFVIGWHARTGNEVHPANANPADDEADPPPGSQVNNQADPPAGPQADPPAAHEDAADNESQDTQDAMNGDDDGLVVEQPAHARQAVCVMRFSGMPTVAGGQDVEAEDAVITHLEVRNKTVSLEMSDGAKAKTARLYVLAMPREAACPPGRGAAHLPAVPVAAVKFRTVRRG